MTGSVRDGSDRIAKLACLLHSWAPMGCPPGGRPPPQALD